ncbi:NDP-hexose 2,3-dehydratase [Actinoalloteichus sp. AHMU CJ021]|uniref:NDP-hexose 2,3-dehydratase family protein n=1 Tax=Actinoalloteichus sp. AHMU CJ021 TaxID=2072503 RepID=UPI000CA03BB3|nr:NDP-hexose 2,3-dehydratase [Actinoalloteichus sp. AHMU CJ021]
MSPAPSVLLQQGDETDHLRIAESARTLTGPFGGMAALRAWFDGLTQADRTTVTRIALDDLTGWSSDPDTGNIGHASGKFFVVEGLEVNVPGAPVPAWTQPIINQAEIGILGILVKEFDGVLHCLMQAKMEPGNCNGAQLSPTVQATKSNYTKVHQGASVPYLEYFVDTRDHRVLADVLQSEQGSWFYHKRNRNMVVEVDDDVELLDGFHWATLGQLYQLLHEDNLVNMDARTVMSCLPFSGDGLVAALPPTDDEFPSAIARSCDGEQGSLHRTKEILGWITDARTRNEVRTTRMPLNEVRDWQRSATTISHDTGLFFNVIAVEVTADNREVRQWTQPMIEPTDTAIVAFLVKRINGVLHLLVHARVEPGYLDVVELAPTVQCAPSNYARMAPSDRPRFLDEVLNARPDRIRFATMLSEEGGRFYHAENRYLIVETDADYDLSTDPDFRWVTLHQLVGLLRHSHYVNVQARSLIACLNSLASTPHGRGVRPDTR